MPIQPKLTTTTKLKTLSVAIAFTVTGCGNSSLSSAVGYFQEGVMGGANLSMSRDDILKIPYAAIAVRLGRGPQAFVVLATDDNHIQQWIAADKRLIETQNSRVTRTIGFDQDLTHTSFLTPDPLAAHLDPTKTYVSKRIVDVTDHTGVSGDVPSDDILVTATLTFSGAETLTIIGVKTPTFLWVENFSAKDVAWSETNRYWQDQRTKTIWKSQQYIAPKLPKLEIVTLRRYIGQ